MNTRFYIAHSWIFTLGICTIFQAGSMADEPAKVPDVIGEEVAFSDPKSTYRAYLDAIRKVDMDAALRCWEYEEKDAAAMEVVVGVSIAHRRMEQVVTGKFKEKENLESLEGWLRADLTDEAIDLAEKMLDNAEVKITGELAVLDMKLENIDASQEFFNFPEQPTFRKIDSQWKLTALENDGLEQDDDFLEKGSWGPMFRASIVMMNEATDKILGGDLKTGSSSKSVGKNRTL